MIGIQGQYLFDVKIGSLSGFLTEADLVVFKLIEEAGNKLPLFEMIFQVNDPAIYRLMNQGNLLKVSFGVNQLNMYDLQLMIVERDRISESANSTFVRLVGTLAAIQYTTANTTYSKTVTTKEAIQELASKFFQYESNITPGNDRMGWVSNSKTVRSFINKLWLHSDVGNDIPMIGITSTGKFRHLALLKHVNQSNKWTLTTNTPNPGEIPLSQLPSVFSNAAAVNLLGGYSRSIIVNDLANAKTKRITPPELGKGILSNSESLDTINAGTRLRAVSYTNDNVYPEYHQRREFNSKHLLMLDSLNAKCYVEGVFCGIQVLDVVMLKDSSYMLGQSVEDTSGLWIVKKVARIIQDKKFHTVITLTRDSINKLTLLKQEGN